MTTLSSPVRTLGLVIMLSAAVSAQITPAERPFGAGAFTKGEFAARRAKVYDAIGDGMVILYGAPKRERYRRWRQHNNFFWLCGVERADTVLVLDGKKREATLFTKRIKAGATAEQERTGLEHVVSIGRFEPILIELTKDAKRLYLPRWPGEGSAQARDSFSRWGKPDPPFDGRSSRPQDFRSGILRIAGEKEVKDLETILDPLRRVKSAAEIAVMRKAARIGAIAIRDAITATRPGILEAELQGVVELACLRAGAHASAWTPIVAAGPNITDFHYMDNQRRLVADDMVLIDAGPDYAYYTTDITRVWPTSGTYPKRWREIYDKLLIVHRKTIAAVKPGMTYRKLTGILRSEARAQGIANLVVGGAGHYTGMSPHDVGSWGEPFVAGVVFNVEPLVIVPEEHLHIRFEDTVLCTENGGEVLTPLDVLPWGADALLKIRDEQR